MSTRRKLGEQTSIPRDTPARIRGLALLAECLAEELAIGNQRRPTGSGSALEALLYKSTVYFTLLM